MQARLSENVLPVNQSTFFIGAGVRDALASTYKTIKEMDVALSASVTALKSLRTNVWEGIR